jgi:hypothetical protein
MTPHRQRGRQGLSAAVGLFALAVVLLARPAGAQQEPGRLLDRTSLWEKTGRDLLRGFDNMYQPCVVQDPGGAYPSKMWFFGWAAQDCNPGYPGCDAIFFARGKDLDHWEVYAGDGRFDATMSPKLWVPVVTAGDKPYDQWHNGDPSVVRFRGHYYMAFSSTGFDLDGLRGDDPKDTDGWLCCVMGAVSSDGIHWRKTSGPILIWDQELGKREAYGSPDYFGDYARPSLLRDGDRWRLWFDYWCPGQGVSMGYAENRGDFTDPAQWKVLRAGAHPVLASFPNPSVIKVDVRYYAYGDPPDYPGRGDPWVKRQVFEATSMDGLNWTVLGYVGPDADTPACQVPQAAVLDTGGRKWIYVFYACQIGGQPYDWRYDRIRCMRRTAEGASPPAR